jgi:hypothetical protein
MQMSDRQKVRESSSDAIACAAAFTRQLTEGEQQRIAGEEERRQLRQARQMNRGHRRQQLIRERE